jgi:hypothetical protein
MVGMLGAVGIRRGVPCEDSDASVGGRVIGKDSELRPSRAGVPDGREVMEGSGAVAARIGEDCDAERTAPL